jgi:hypothetical protein
MINSQHKLLRIQNWLMLRVSRYNWLAVAAGADRNPELLAQTIRGRLRFWGDRAELVDSTQAARQVGIRWCECEVMRRAAAESVPRPARREPVMRWSPRIACRFHRLDRCQFHFSESGFVFFQHGTVVCEIWWARRNYHVLLRTYLIL